MGEYATRHDGQHVKIGTCENLFGLRFDQIEELASSQIDFTSSALGRVRFRFPFPDEDFTRPGEFRTLDRAVSLRCELPFLSEPDTDHYRVQYADTHKRGLLVNLPCPASAEARQVTHDGEPFPRVQFNGFAGPVGIVQQRVWDARLVLVVECGCCGARYRLVEESEVEPIYTALEDYAQREDLAGDESRARYYRTVSQRIRDGYTTAVPGTTTSKEHTA